MKRTIKLKHKKRLKLVSQIIYNKAIAKSFHDTRYYESLESDVRNLPFREQQRKRIATNHRKKVSIFFRKCKSLLESKSQGVFDKLYRIYKKNKKAAFGGKPAPIHSDLLYLASSVPMLVFAYRKISKNKGASTLGYYLSEDRYFRLNGIQRSFTNKTFNLPDGMSKEIFVEASKLLRAGKYPWGSSRRIYIDKPGQPGVMRPITIPPFMDRVVQSSIAMLLNCIYEPWFEVSNCSFGFRPNKGVHDAIVSISNARARGMNKAIEGDIKSAYDKVCREKLISILGKRIKDKKFLKLIKERLNYQYWDSKEEKYVQDKEGIPQGGIDSPYLWNIYMMEFDNFVKEHTTRLFDQLNTKVRRNMPLKKLYPGKEKRQLERLRRTTKWIIYILNKFPNDMEKVKLFLSLTIEKRKTLDEATKQSVTIPSELLGLPIILKTLEWKKCTDLTEFKYKAIKYNNKLNHRFFKMPGTEYGRLHLRFLYARYADDWILLTNAPITILENLKSTYKEFLETELKATLSLEKTLLTDMKKKPAHFLGFEIKVPSGDGIGRYIKLDKDGNLKNIKATTSGKEIYILPDRQRLISRLHMKGYCSKKGFPKEMGWLSYLEPHIIIEKYNSVIRGMANYYTEFVRTPQKSMARWLYIIRYSCLKTLAQKYNTSIRKILAKFPYRKRKWEKSTERTVQVTIQHTINGKKYKKSWKLLTTKEALNAARNIKRKEKVFDTYWSLERNNPMKYITKQKSPAITDDSYLDTIKWVNLRTQSSLDAPCSICGSETDVEMHHLKSVRKKRYELIPEDKTWEKVMYLRNRKQIPVCKECHLNLIHKGKYGGTKLGYFAPKVMYDNRLITLESHVQKGVFKDYTKSLEEKGWKQINSPKATD